VVPSGVAHQRLLSGQFDFICEHALDQITRQAPGSTVLLAHRNSTAVPDGVRRHHVADDTSLARLTAEAVDARRHTRDHDRRTLFRGGLGPAPVVLVSVEASATGRPELAYL